MSYPKLVTFLLYLLALSYVVFFSPGRNTISTKHQTVHLIPFENTIHAFHALKNHTLRARAVFLVSNFVGNIILFIPFPLLLLRFSNSPDQKLIIICALFTSFLIEYVQFLFGVGVADIDDFALNTVGVFTGIYLWKWHIRNYRLK
jgi:glycopeptide antibiotics resistance protein